MNSRFSVDELRAALPAPDRLDDPTQLKEVTDDDGNVTHLIYTDDHPLYYVVVRPDDGSNALLVELKVQDHTYRSQRVLNVDKAADAVTKYGREGFALVEEDYRDLAS
jgi:hypothetical protein